ncbi:MAG TPA: hypothetical protein PLL92_08170 [Alicycliphilus sp.]|nr:hypothetical protein [Alicycliphilus sp.]
MTFATTRHTAIDQQRQRVLRTTALAWGLPWSAAQPSAASPFAALPFALFRQPCAAVGWSLAFAY